jgi:hypothetical protein
MAKLGVQGCGFEHPLAALRAALAPSNAANAGFLRPGALLAIIIITDEDDCSAPPTTDLFQAPRPGESPNFICAREGHLCRGREVSGPELSVALSDCAPRERGKLVPVREIVDFVRQLKSPGGGVAVAGIFGWPEIAGEGRYEVKAGTSGTEVQPVCRSRNGSAVPGLRMKAFLDAFGAAGSVHSICQDDLREPMRRIGAQVRTAVCAEF